MAIRYRTIEITPSQAEHLLSKNQDSPQRRINDADVDKYAADMKAGRWKVTGEAVIISETDKILDGYHRLWACVCADKPFETMMVTGVPDEALHVIDTGRPRTLQNVFQINGRPETKTVLSAARVVGIVAHGETHATKYSYDAMVKVIAKHKGLAWIGSVAPAQGKVVKGIVNGGVFAGLALGWEKSQKTAEDAFDRLTSGAGMTSGDPILTLREHLLHNPIGKGGGTRNGVHNCYRVLTALSYAMRNKPMRRSYASEEGVNYFGYKLRKDDEI